MRKLTLLYGTSSEWHVVKQRGWACCIRVARADERLVTAVVAGCGRTRCSRRLGMFRHHFYTPSWICVFFLLILRLGFVVCDTAGDISGGREENDRGLFPPTFNLAYSAIISANATCGEKGEEMFCKLVEHVREPQCGICDTRSYDDFKRHPITNAIDGTNRWWQSPSLQNGRQYQWVTITLDLRQIFQVAYVIVKAANSPRPGNWILERSLDGITFKPWQYYAISHGECLDVYGISPTIGIPRYRSDDEVICTSRYSQLEPLENGEIHTSLVKGRPGVTGPSDKLQEFTAARYVRLRLQKIRTLNADLMTVHTQGWEKVHKSVTRRLFYSIKDISIGGQCMCFGHARDCPLDVATGRLRCRCVHNTCGDSCEKCCPLYNQKPWRVGTSEGAGICSKCQCYGHSHECRYDKDVAARKESINVEGRYDGGGVCLNCRDFTTGYNCEKCIEGYYRPLGVQPDAPRPCLRCFCEGVGTVGHCVGDSSRLHQGLKPGDCICKTGFSGPRCSRCAVGYRNYPVCDLCPCNAAGTVNTDCEGDCICKPNVDGIRCDRCKPGYFNLDRYDPRGCTQCYCFGITTRCISADLGVQVIAPRLGWQVSDILGQKVIRPFVEDGILTVANDDMTGYDTYYWLAPDNFTGNMLSAYSGRLHFNLSWVRARGDSAGWPTRGPSVILDGGGMLIAYDEQHGIRRADNVVASVTLSENGWYHITSDISFTHKKTKKKPQESVTRRQFMAVLHVLDRVLIQSKFNTDQIVGKLHSASMEVGSASVPSLARLRGVEKCLCPPGYAGLSCENCEVGYRRVNTTAHKGECRKCDCHGHADRCDPYSGECNDCRHDTTGNHCEKCREGFYGVATRGTPLDCRMCACPLEDTQKVYKHSCMTTVNTTSGDVGYICTQCPVGHVGNKCERCADGFFGNPLVPGNYCQPCECGRQSDISIAGRCDSLTGECIRCEGNTKGWHCDECIDGFFGNPLVGDCEPCNCNIFGSANGGICVKATGQCECRARYTGLKCEQCIENYGNVAIGCVPCSCHEVGSVSTICDPVSGLCDCKPGVFGAGCDTCLDGYYDFSDVGCKWCACHPDGSVFTNCTQDVGHCQCLPHVTGTKCDKCLEGFWNLSSSKGCEPCSCNTAGSLSPQCDLKTGQCECRQGVGGVKCERCLPGHFGLSTSGCKVCGLCDRPGHICDPKTGECVCPPFTRGPRCEQCKRHYWGYDPVEGCKPCDCNADGSEGLQCNADTGNCTCLEGYEGRHCSKCRFSYFDFPNCKRCKCHQEGTDPLQCRDGHCQCTEDGQCPCRVNVDGKKCRRCKLGTFGRTPVQREGCFECFCFGKTSKCSSAEYSWIQLAHSGVRQVTSERQESSLYILNGLRVIPGTTGNVDVQIPLMLDAPLYWSLPDMFKGDKVLSYNGHLSFRVRAEGGTPFPDSVFETYPLVQLQGNFRLVLEFYPKNLAPDGRYDVRLHEDFWKIKNNHESQVTRAIMMVALQNIQHLLIRGTDRSDFTSATLEDVVMDVAVPAAPLSPVVAVGIEICVCPPQYNGTSCQDPADGFYRKRKKDFSNSKDILDLVGIAVPCECNNRSKICHKETGVCQNCEDNWDGPHCEKCAIGFYEDPNKGDCRQCACPTAENSFSKACVVDGFGLLICTSCEVGYSGNRCETCAPGYYGDPLTVGGTCRPCSCDLRGSVGEMCDRNSGQCICLEGLTGRDCSQCSVRHVLTITGCQACDDECITLLLDDLDYLNYLTANINVSDVDPAPWATLYAIDAKAVALKENLTQYENAVKHGEMLIFDFENTFDLKGSFSLQFAKSKEIRRKAIMTSGNASDTFEMSHRFLQSTLDVRKVINETVKRLKDYFLGVVNASVSIDTAIQEAERLLNEIRLKDFSAVRIDADSESRKAQATLERVKKLIFNSTKLRGVQDDLRLFKGKLDDLMRSIVGVEANLTSAKLKNTQNRERLEPLRDLENKVKIATDGFVETKEEGGVLLNEAKEVVDQATENFLMLESFLQPLQNLSYRLEGHVNRLLQLLPRYFKDYVIPAVDHADELTRRAKLLTSAFQSTRNDSDQALKAAMAYEDIAKAIYEAHNITLDAITVAKNASMMAFPEPSSSLSKLASMAANISRGLRSDAKRLQTHRIPDLHRKLKKEENSLIKMADVINSTKTMLAIILDDIDRLQKMTEETREKLSNVFDNISNLTSTIMGVHEKVDAFVRENATLHQRLEAVEAASKGGVEHLNQTVHRIEKLNAVLNDKLTNLSKINSSTSIKRGILDKQLAVLMNNITLAKHRAAGISVSLSGSGGRCSRRLRYFVKSSATNSITFLYSVVSNVTNSLLLYIGDANYKDKASDFLAVEMVNRKMRLVFNTGEETVVVEHPLVIRSNNEVYSNFSEWYKVTVERVGSRGTLKVHSFMVKEDQRPVSGSSKSGNEQINFGNEAPLYIGGVPSMSKKPEELKSRYFDGCMFNLKVDGNNIGFWDFISYKTNYNDGCTACKKGPEEAVTENVVTFNGNGYATADTIWRRRARFRSLIIDVKTFDHNSLLVVCPNPEKSSFVSIALERGRIVYLLRPDNNPDIEPMRIVSNMTYNTGEWFKVDVFYNDETTEGQLKVSVPDSTREKENPKVSHFPTSIQSRTFALPSTMTCYLGGVPPMVSRVGWENVTSLPFRGCMRDLSLNVNLVNMIKGKNFGVIKGCREQIINAITASGDDGYVEMPGFNLTEGSQFGFTFQPMKSDGLLMISTFLKVGSGNKDFYSLALKDGILYFRYRGREMKTPYKLALYSSHFVFVHRSGNDMTFRLNDTVVETATSAKKMKMISSPKEGGLFFGGVPDLISDKVVKQDQSVTSEPFRGIIRDVYFDHSLLDFSKALDVIRINFGVGNVTVERPKVEPPLREPKKQTTTDSKLCKKPSQINLANYSVKLGDSENGFIRLNLKEWLDQINFSFVFNFRTFYPNGLLFLVQRGSRDQHYFSMQLVNGAMELILKSNQKKHIIKDRFHDGEWHMVNVTKKARRLAFSVGKKSKTLSIPNKLNVQHAFYMGNVSSLFKPRRPPKFPIIPFRGCIRDFKINNTRQDLSANAQNVGQCFLKVEGGSRFGGDAFAIYDNNFVVGEIMEIQLEFRTIEVEGVLLSISERGNSPALSMELYDGKVVMSVSLDAGKVSRLIATVDGDKGSVCDNEWHTIKASYSQEFLNLRVDKNEPRSDIIRNTIVKEIRTQSPLYVGGLPDDAPNGVLHSRENFKGCIRNLVIGERARDWIDMHKLVRIQLNSCEIP